MTHGIFGLVPVRGFATGKSRLAGELSVGARASIMQWMLRGVIDAALTADVLDNVAVISPDTSVLAYARSLDERVTPILQHPNDLGLNQAAAAGRDWAARRGASRLLVIFADLPQLTAPDVRAIVAHSAEVVVATDRHELGTNALLTPILGDGSDFEFQYGEGSARRHAAEAGRLGLSSGVIQRPGTEFDLDTPEDWRTLSNTTGVGAGQIPIPNGANASPWLSELALSLGEGRCR